MASSSNSPSVEHTAKLEKKNTTAVSSDIKGIGPDEERVMLQQFGGGPRTWTYDEIREFLLPDFNVDNSEVCSTYAFVAYVDIALVEQHVHGNPNHVPCRLPLKHMANALLVSEMRAICNQHNIDAVRLDTKVSLKMKIEAHVCDDDCPDFVAILEGIQERTQDPNEVKLASRNFTFRDLLSHLGCNDVASVSLNTPCVLVGFANSEQDVEEREGISQVCVNLPADTLYPRLTKRGLLEISKRHNLSFPFYWTRAKALEQLQRHVCHERCTAPMAIFEVQGPKVRQKKTRVLEPDDDSPFEWPPLVVEGNHAFPPKPATIKDIARCIGSYTEALKPEHIEEWPCAVCAQLHKVRDLQPFSKDEFPLDPLMDTSETRRERRQASDPIQPLEGPILLPGAKHICSPCATALKKNKMPDLALANGFWIGEIPRELDDLTLGEKALISRVRRNRSLVRVSKGHYKMVANVISWPNPVVKVYAALPPPREDLDDVLAIIFTGTEPPTEEDSKRSPLLVRRKKVLQALEWLKLNNRDYEEVLIDHEALASYDEEGIPVVVYHRPIPSVQGNQPGLAMPLYNEEERGSEYGPCPYSVHGLSTTKFSDLTPTKRKDIALQWLTEGGGALGVGRGANPLSLYDNPTLYTQMFPWLFPYGLGGVGGVSPVRRVSESKHCKWLLGYSDRRFQMESHFVITAFNHQQIKTSSSKSFVMVKRGNFASVAESIKEVNPAVLSSISQRMKDGERVVPQTDMEKRCFRLLEQIERVGGHVDGSLAKRKFMRNELWSLVSFKGAPNWYITISPADNRHPLAIYWAGLPEPYKPDIKDSTLRDTLISQNPVASANFFNYLVELFLTHIIGWGKEENGVFGKAAAYFGTVEQQGRMTLHLHLVLWIEGSLTPKEIREKLTGGDKEFERKLLEYLESCRVGEFMTGSKSEVRSRIPRHTLPRNRGIHTIYAEEANESGSGNDNDEGREDENGNIDEGYRDPTLDMPAPPPRVVCDRPIGQCLCQNCLEVSEWFEHFKRVVDDVVYRTNVHECHAMKGVSIPGLKQHPTGKGCTGQSGKCSARFPREVVTNSNVDPNDGHINLKQLESSINTVNPSIVYTNVCNTDTTCMQSGTAVKAVVGYVCDYLTKGGLKSHQIFSTMYDAFTRFGDSLLGEDKKAVDGARRMILKIVNSLGAKMEIGAPMAAMYLQGQPDRYSSHVFVSFYWKNYVNFVMKEWDRFLGSMEAINPQEIKWSSENLDMGEELNEEGEQDVLGDDDEGNETVRLTRNGRYFISRSNVEDYQLRPLQHESVCLYEWVQCAVRDTSKASRDGLKFFRYLPEHPMAESHKIACDPDRRHYVVPNFLGPALPRPDEGDPEEYYCTMLTLFKPWRSGIDLRRSDMSWQETFEAFPFTKRQSDIIRYFNVRYECYDARDDFQSIRRKEENEEGTQDDEGQGCDIEDAMDIDLHDGEQDESYWRNKEMPDAWYINQETFVKEAEQVLHHAGWKAHRHFEQQPGDGTLVRNQGRVKAITCSKGMTAAYWSELVKKEKARVWKERFIRLNGERGPDEDGEDGVYGPVRDGVFVVFGDYLSSTYIPRNRRWVDTMEELETKYTLNPEQRRSFRIIANHACTIAPEPLLKFLGGMAGAGKTQVLRALIEFFAVREEPYRLVLLGPTGTSSALIGGTTYHSFLSIFSGKWASGKAELQAVEEVRERLLGVSYIFIDEVSMLSCLDVCRISARLCDAMNEHEKPFGGLSMIFAGDFAQLPPTKGHALYSGDVSFVQSPRSKPEQQEETIGKTIWLQFTCVVMLKRNMRQVGESDDDKRFRVALENLRYKACTEADIEFLRSRIPSYNDKVSIEDDKFKFVSIITSRNVQKDSYNHRNALKFATEHGEILSHFYSIDSMSGTRQMSGSGREGMRSGLHQREQRILWAQRPSSSEQVAGCLSLCIGMPVMIRNNEATDLCITRGQEGIVVGWNAREIPGFPGYKSLDTLFVELVRAPKQIQLGNLPPNVVPLTKIAHPITAKLPNGEMRKISRKQVPVLPNFSMTDYASQGKTREVNVVDLARCRSHQAMYTCLSRGKRAEDTLIVRDFPVSMMTGGISGWLRQEFRELNYLDKITELRFEGKLPDDIMQQTRWATIDNYKRWRNNNDEDSWHPVLRAEPKPDEWQRPKADVKLSDRPHGKRGQKRKREVVMAVTKKKRKLGLNPETGQTQTTTFGNSRDLSEVLLGPTWDSEDHSCAFDAWLFILHSLWTIERLRWVQELSALSSSMTMLTLEFHRLGTTENRGRAITQVRDRWREMVREEDGDEGNFPTGSLGADICTLSSRLWGRTRRVGSTTGKCSGCDYSERVRGHRNIAAFTILDETQAGGVQHHLRTREETYGLCPNCGNEMFWVHTATDIFCVQTVCRAGIEITVEPVVRTASGETFIIFGAIYHRAGHFFAKVMVDGGDLYVHDGIRGHKSTRFGNAREREGTHCWSRLDGGTVSQVVYRKVIAEAL
jgi:hypothetical protein